MFDSTPEARGQGRATRISISLGDVMVQRLQDLAQREGRSLSNLCARLLENALDQHERIE